MKKVSVSPALSHLSAETSCSFTGFAELNRNELYNLELDSNVHRVLLDSFPALAFALATGYGTIENRVQTYQYLNQGGNLRNAARILGLPWWLRKVPPECFSRPINALPTSEKFARRITNLIPERQRDLQNWFRCVLRASEIGDDDFAIWIARHKELWMEPDILNLPLELLASWAWFGKQKEHAEYIPSKRRWHRNIGLQTALEEAKAWYNRIRLIVLLGKTGLEDSWLNGDSVMGYDFRPLRTAADFFDESKAMKNCLDQYADHIRFDDVRVFSIWKQGQRIANIEIGAHEDDSSIPTIEQLRGAGNQHVPANLWQAAYAWMGNQAFKPRPTNRRSLLAKHQNSAAHQIWQPYVQYVYSKKHHVASEYPLELPITDISHSDTLLIQLETIISYIESNKKLNHNKLSSNLQPA